MDAPVTKYTLTAFDDEGEMFHERRDMMLTDGRFVGRFFAKRGARVTLRAQGHDYAETYAPDLDADRKDGEAMAVTVTVSCGGLQWKLEGSEAL